MNTQVLYVGANRRRFDVPVNYVSELDYLRPVQRRVLLRLLLVVRNLAVAS